MFDYFSYIDYMEAQWNHGYPDPEDEQEPEPEQEPEAPQQPANPYDEY